MGMTLMLPIPKMVLLRTLDVAALRQGLEAPPEEFREVVVMRDLEGLSYKEIAEVTEAPIGTVMSRLARGRGWHEVEADSSGSLRADCRKSF
jgi:DNA-directed RNA polymerase specialized sigma24 family protein